MAKFTKVPTCLIYCLDRNCLQIFTLLVNRWYYWESNDKLIDNQFFAITNEDLRQITHLSNRTIIEVISTLYNNNIIEVKSEGQQGKRVPNYYAINWNQIEELDKLELSELKNKQIKKIARGMSCSYRNDSIIISPKENTTIESKIESTSESNNKIESKIDVVLIKQNQKSDSTNHFVTDFCQNVTLHNIKDNINNNIGPIYNNIITELSFKDNSVIDNNTSNNNSSMTNWKTESTSNGIKENNNNKEKNLIMKEEILLRKINKMLGKITTCKNITEIRIKAKLLENYIVDYVDTNKVHNQIQDWLGHYCDNMLKEIANYVVNGYKIDTNLVQHQIPTDLHQYYTNEEGIRLSKLSNSSTIEEKVNEADSASKWAESRNNNTELKIYPISQKKCLKMA